MDVQSWREDDAVVLLRALCGEDGIHASLAATANYRAIFARDAIMAGTAGLLLRDAVVTRAFVCTLERLRQFQGAEGQIASNFELRPDGTHQLSFGSLAPRIDSATWYLLGIAFGAKAGALDPAAYHASVHAVVRLLNAIEYNERHLLYVPTGGNWADEYITEGYILYDQVLRAWALRLLGEVYDESAWTAKSARIGETIHERYWLDVERKYGHPIASFSPGRVQAMFDLAACSLLSLSGVAPTLGAAALDWIDDTFLTQSSLPPAFYPVIVEGDSDWPALRRYHLHAFRNAPHEYHNGGIWPIWLGWCALALAQAQRSSALQRLASEVQRRLNAPKSFAFEEYLHGVTGVPTGTPHMAYSATGCIFMAHAGRADTREFFAR